MNNKAMGAFSKAKRRDTLFYIVIVAIPFFNFCFLNLYQNYISVFLYATKTYDYATGQYIFQSDIFANFKVFFRELASSPDWADAFRVSLKTYILNWLVNVPISLFVPYYIVRKCVGSNAFKFILMLPSMLSSMIWVLLYNNFVEIAWVEMWGLDFGPLSNKDQQWTAIWIQSLITGFGANMLLYTGMYSSVSDGTLDAAKIDGMGVLREIWHLYFPVLYSVWVVGVVTGINSLFAGTGPIEYFGQSANEEVRTIGYILFYKVMYSSRPQDAVIACAGNIVFTMGVLPLVLVSKKLLTYYGPSEDERKPIRWFWQKRKRGN